jgi:hypothetical protein
VPTRDLHKDILRVLRCSIEFFVCDLVMKPELRNNNLMARCDLEMDEKGFIWIG